MTSAELAALLIIAKKGRHARTRSNGFTSDEPADWAPYKVTNPDTQMGFSDATAWNLICDLIEHGHEFRAMILDKPPGSVGFTTTVQLSDGTDLYIKVQLLKDLARGRSFHISTRKAD